MRISWLAMAAAAATLVAAHAAAQAATPRVWVTLPAYPAPIALDTVMSVSEIDAPAGRVWSASEKVFYDYKISTDTRDSVRGVVGVAKYSKSNYLSDFRMSQVLNCGIGLTGPNADNFRISMAIMAIVVPISATRARLGVAFIGSGLDMRGNSSDPVACATTGRLEQDFVVRIKKILATP